MTTLTFHLARALGTQFARGDEIRGYRTGSSCQRRAVAAFGAGARRKVKVVKLVPETGQLDWESFEQLLTKRTKLVAIGAASNALGTINDLERAIANGALGWRARFRGRGSLRPSRARRCESARLRFPRDVGLQILWATRRRACLAKQNCLSRSTFRNSFRRLTPRRRMSKPAHRIRKAWSARVRQLIFLRRLLAMDRGARACVQPTLSSIAEMLS